MAAQRWVAAMLGPRYSTLALTLPGDSHYAMQPFFELISKPNSHKHLYQELEPFQSLGKITELTERRWTDKCHEMLRYRFVNDVVLNTLKTKAYHFEY